MEVGESALGVYVDGVFGDVAHIEALLEQLGRLSGTSVSMRRPCRLFWPCERTRVAPFWKPFQLILPVSLQC